MPHREVPAGWQEELDRLVPKHDRTTWLKLAWMPGIFYEPVGRWVIYEMAPLVSNAEGRCNVHPDVLGFLKGPSPRDPKNGSWVRDTTIASAYGGHRWQSHSAVSLLQWQLFQETGCYPVLWWIIQGSAGGHRWRLSASERRYVKTMFGEASDVPNPGDLPYAEWDRRVIEQIARADRLRVWETHYGKGWLDRSRTVDDADTVVLAEEDAIEKRYSEDLLRWFDGQIEDAVRAIPQSMIPDVTDLPIGDPYYNAGAEELEARLTAPA